MRFLSICSGVEAQSVAWSRLGWQAVAFSEIDPFACAVLAARFPDVPNLGDVTKIDWSRVHERFGNIDVLFASTPCTSFSIAGNRLGLSGESGLALEFGRAVRELVAASGGVSPRYLVYENVPGMRSSGPKGAKGSDFGCLLSELGDCGYGLGWRVLDSQFARAFDRSSGRFRGPVPQRRRRVYLVGCLGTDGSGEILFERSCLSGNHPKGRKAREALAESAEGRAGLGGCAGFKWFQGAAARGIGYGETSPTLAVADSHPPAVVSVSTANTKANGSNVSTDNVAYTLDSTNCNAVCIQGSMIGRADKNGPQGCGYDEETSFTLNTVDRHAVVFESDGVTCVSSVRQNSPVDSNLSGTLDAGHEQPIIVIDRAAFNQGENAKYPPPCGADADDGRARGEGSPCCVLSNGDEVIGALCATDCKWVQNQQVNQGKIVCQRVV